jgi:hypothetical protein
MTLRSIALSVALLALASSPSDAQVRHRASGHLASFSSNAELARYLERLADAQKARYDVQKPAPCGGASSVAHVVRPPKSATTGMPIGGAVIRGAVKDVAGKAVAGASVAFGSIGRGVNTDSSGQYRVAIPADSLAKPRTVTLVVRRIGFDARRHEITLQQRDTAQVDFALCAASFQLNAVVATSAPMGPMGAAFSADESVTNTQHQGVDEGGIVKVHGDYLVMLRRGRLFTVDIGDRSMRPIAAVDAFGPGIDPRAAWYDELLVYGDKVVVIGYSYQRGGTELGVFHIDRAGGLRHLSTYQLRSNDYYSSRNYASRLVNGKLVFYTPLYLSGRTENVLDALPAMRRWRGDTSATGFERIVTPRQVYRPARELEMSSDLALHTVTTCDLSTEALECSASAVIGPSGRVFYVSPTSVYVWVSEWNSRTRGDEGEATLYRMPLDGSAPSATATSGSPVDQFSFLEGEDGFLNVVVRAESGGDAMWRAHHARGSIALLRLPLESFGDGRRAVPWSRYTALPTPSEGDFQNRFVGDHLLYGAGNGWGPPRTTSSDLYVVGLGRRDVTRLELPHGIDRIETMGSNAVVVGAHGADLHFSGIALGDRPAVAQRYVMSGASQGEMRSHGFFYKPDGEESGVIGLPVRGAKRPGYSHLREGSASILFLRNSGRELTPLGELYASPMSEQDDGCRASCVDWYGNARPLFARGRVFALLGYELVEGVIADGRIREVGRVSYAPRVIQALSR